MTLLEEIDMLREEAARLAKASNEPATGPVDRVHYRLTLEEGIEPKIDAKLMQYIALPDCPLCRGKLETQPIAHVLKCSTCAALLLPGRMAPVYHVERT